MSCAPRLNASNPIVTRWPWLLGALCGALWGWFCAWLLWPESWRLQLFCAFIPAAWCTGFAFRDVLLSNPEAALWFFLTCAGIPILAFTPPIASVSWDGQNHFSNALALAQGGNARYSGADRIMANRDGIYDVGLIPYGTSDDDWSPNWRLSLSEEGLQNQIQILEDAEANGEPLQLFGLSRLGDDEKSVGMAGFGIVARTPLVIGLWLGRALGLPLLWTYAMGRVANYLTWCVLSWIALRRLLAGKWLFLAICLLPTQLYIAGNWSYDPWVVGFAAIATTSLIGALQRKDEKLRASEVLWMIVPFYLSCAVKAIFFPWGVVFLFMPKSKFKRSTTLWLWRFLWIGAMTALLVGFMTPFIASHGASNVDTQAVSAVSPWDQLVLMSHEPWHYLTGLLLTTLDYTNPLRIVSDLPVNLCYLPRPWLWWVLSAAELCLLGWLSLSDRSEADAWATTRAGRRLRIGAAAGFVVAFGALLTSLYVSYNEVGSNYILGMQTRYYLMFLPLLLGCALDGDATRVVTKLWQKLPPRMRVWFGLPPHIDHAAKEWIEAYPHPWWIAKSPRTRRTLVLAEAIFLSAFVLFGFVVWFIA